MKFTAIVMVALVCTVGVSAYNSEITVNLIEQINDIGHQSEYMNVVMEAVQIHLENKGPIEVILRLLKELDDELTTEQHKHDAYVKLQRRIWKMTKAILEAEIAKWTAEVNRLTVIINKVTARRNKAIAAKKATEANLSANLRTQHKLTARRIKEHNTYLKHKKNLQDAIVGLKEILPEVAKLLKDWRTNKPTGKAPGMPKLMKNPNGVSLVQIRSLQKKIAVVHTLLRHDIHSDWLPLAAALANIAMDAQYFADAGKVNQIMKLLVGVQHKFEREVVKITHDEAESVRQYKIQMANLKKEEANLRKRISQLTHLIARLNDRLHSLNKQRNYAKARVARAKSDLAQALSFWVKVQHVYRVETAKRNHDHKIVAMVRKIFVGLKWPTIHK